MSTPERLKVELSDDAKDLLDACKYMTSPLGAGVSIVLLPGSVGELAKGKLITGAVFALGGLAAAPLGFRYGEGIRPVEAYKEYKNQGLRWYADRLAVQALRPRHPQPEPALVITHPAAVEENLPSAA